MQNIENKIITKFLLKKLTLSVAESCTGGLLSNRITDISGASGSFVLGAVTYANSAKTDILGVPKRIFNEHGAVSQECALAMAKGIRRRGKSDYGLSITGIAGPTGGSKSKPVGTVFIALSCADRSVCRKFRFTGSRKQIKRRSADAALKLLLQCLKSS